MSTWPCVYGCVCLCVQACRATSLGMNLFQSLSLFPNQLSHGCHMHSPLYPPLPLSISVSHTHRHTHTTPCVKSLMPVVGMTNPCRDLFRIALPLRRQAWLKSVLCCAGHMTMIRNYPRVNLRGIFINLKKEVPVDQ